MARTSCVGQLLFGALTALALIASGVILAPAEAATVRTVLCTGLSDCSSYGTFGYAAAGTSAASSWNFAGASNGHNCTKYVGFRFQQTGIGRPSWLASPSDAATWGDKAPAGTVNGSPTVGSVAWWRDEGGYGGHVAIVQHVLPDGSFITSDDVYAGDFHWRKYTTGGGGMWPSGFIHINDAALGGGPEVHDPQGSFDGSDTPTAGVLHVRGWAFDADAPTTPLDIHVYVGASAGQPGAEGHDIGLANVSRGDVGAAFPGVGENHGFDQTFQTNLVGNQRVYVYAISTAGGNNSLLGTQNQTVADPSPIGNFDDAYSPGGGQAHVSGWALDFSTVTTPLRIDAYVGGPAGTAGAEGHSIGYADQDRGDVAATFPGTGPAHGFDHTFSTSLTGRQPIFLYAINVDGTPGNNTFMGSRDVTIDPAPSPVVINVPSLPAPPEPEPEPEPEASPTPTPSSPTTTSSTTTVSTTPVSIGPLGKPKIHGHLKVGSRVATPSMHPAVPGMKVTYRWYRGKKAIPRATSRFYRIRSTDYGARLRVVVTVNLHGTTHSVTSGWSKRVRRN